MLSPTMYILLTPMYGGILKKNWVRFVFNMSFLQIFQSFDTSQKTVTFRNIGGTHFYQYRWHAVSFVKNKIV